MSDIDVFAIQKQPGDRRTRAVDFASKLPDTVTITGATVGIVDADTLQDFSASMLASTIGTVDGSSVLIVILGGEDRREYKITVTATLSSGDILTADVLLSVREF